MEYYSPTKRNEALIHAKSWTNLENVMLRQRIQTQKTMYCRIPFI